MVQTRSQKLKQPINPESLDKMEGNTSNEENPWPKAPLKKNPPLTFDDKPTDEELRDASQDPKFLQVME